MRLVIVRHGKAKQDSEDGTDFARELRGRGERQAAYVGEQLRREEPAVAKIVSSRAARAWRTAQIIGERVGIAVEADDALLVDEPVGVVIERIASWASSVHGALVIVGHNPQLSVLAGLLGGGGVGSAVGLGTGEAAVLEINPDEPIGGMLLDRIRLVED